MSSPSGVVCREVFDENSQPSAEEICEYAQQLGIDPESESHLLPLARDGLMQALPAPWKAYYDEKLQTHYYYNEETKKTQWEHPLDNVYRDLVKKARDASMQDDTCASVQELPTSEENTKNLERVETKVESDEELSTDSENHGIVVKENTANMLAKRLTPLGRPPLSPLTKIDKKLADTRISPLRRSVDGALSKPSLIRNPSDKDLLSRHSLERPKMLFKQQSEIIDLKIHVLSSPEEGNYKPLFSNSRAEKGLPLTGKGNMFLKLSKSDLPSPDAEKSSLVDSMTKSDPPKGILREKMSDAFNKIENFPIKKPKQASSFDEDKKSVRFKLENLPDPTISPGSNSSSEQNDGQSSIISAAPAPFSSHIITVSSTITKEASPIITTTTALTSSLTIVTETSPIITSPIVTVSSTKVNELSALITSPTNMAKSSPIPNTSATSSTATSSPPIIGSSQMPIKSSIVLAPLVTRPPLPPRLSDSPRDLKSFSLSEKDSADSDSRDRAPSPRRRLVRPPAADYIKPDLFQKNFQKISDLVRPGDIETASIHLEEPVISDKETRPRSPMIPQKSKISINLMESIESETSIDSPEREFANLDLNDLDDSNDIHLDTSKELTNYTDDKKKDDEYFDKENSIDSDSNRADKNTENTPVPQIKVPNLVFLNKSIHSESEDSKKPSVKDEMSKSSKSSLDITNFKTHLKVSPTYSLGSEIRSPRLDFGKQWSPLSTFKPLNKAIISPQIKTSESASSLGKNLASPRLDGVMLSQGKSSTDNVVVVYQFETQDENITQKTIKSPLIPDMGTRDFIERNKSDEKRRLELLLQKELESLRVEWTAKEKRMRLELQEELKAAEEKFKVEKNIRLTEQEERYRSEMEEALSNMEREHLEAVDKAKLELEERYMREIDLVEKQHQDRMARIQNESATELEELKRQLEIGNDCTLRDLREQLQANLTRDRTRMIEENRFTLETLRDDHITRVTDLKNDYRAEVERLRVQHAWHLEELRSRQVGERSAAIRDQRALAEKYRCLKEKYARLKHDVKMSLERRNKRREMSMTTGSETEKSNSHKTNNLERCKEVNEVSTSVVIESESNRVLSNNNQATLKYNDNETSQSESNNTGQKPSDNNNHGWRLARDNFQTIPSADTSQASEVKQNVKSHRKTTVAFREPPHRRKDTGATTDCQDSSDATTADEKPKESISGPGRRRCFTRLKSASTSRLNYSPKRGEGWSSPLESLRQQLRKLDDLEDQFPDLACQPAYSLRYPFAELVVPGSIPAVSGAETPELEFVRHRALVEREGMRRARAVLKRRRAALRETNATLSPHRAPSEATTSEASSGGSPVHETETSGAVLRSLRALHADVRDIWRALDARRTHTASPETSSCNAPTTSQTRLTLSAPEQVTQDHSDGGIAERAKGLRAWLQTAP